jgi:hypothetical protein
MRSARTERGEDVIVMSLDEFDETAPLTDEEYEWVMHCAKRGGPDDPRDRDRYWALRGRLDAGISDQEHHERTAYHEAARAVAGHAIGLGVRTVLIRDDHSGEVEWSGSWNATPTVDEAFRRILTFATISAAGYVAEQMRWRYARAPERNLVGQVTNKLHEFQLVYRPLPETILVRLSAGRGQGIIGTAAALVEQQEALARDILRSHWATVEHLAARVIAQRYIDGEELAAILASIPVVEGV